MLSQCLVILIVALLIIKPERLPEIAFKLGQWMQKLKLFYDTLMKKTVI